MNKNNSVKIAVSQSPNPEMHYVSGLTLYREQFANGKLIGKRWSANGRTGPEEGFSEPKIDVPCQAFSLNIDGQSLDWGWEFISADVTERDGKRLGTIELRHTVRPVGIKVLTEVDGTSFLSRWLEITNIGNAPVSLSSLDVFSGVLASGSAIPREDFQKTPYLLGRFTGNNWAQEGRFVWDPLVNGVVTCLQPMGPYGTCGYQCPYFLLSNRYTPEFFAFYLGWSGQWKAEILCDTTLQRILHMRIGPTAAAPMRILKTGKTITTPKVHIGYLTSDLDGCIQASHRHIRSSVFLVSPKMKRPLLTHNSYFLGFDNLDESAILSDIDLACELGAEVYMIDAGWYGRASDERRKSGPYPRLMGDWVPGEWFPRGFSPIVKRIREKGMLFGLWIESELIRVIKDYHVDIIRFDGAPMSSHIGERIEDGYIENITWRHYETLYAIMENLVKQFPNLLIENCCGGGGRLDLGILSRSHRTQITDETRPPRTVQILNGISMMLPPEFCFMYPPLENKFGPYDMDFLFRVILFTGFYYGVHMEENPDYLAGLKRYINLYKNFVAPMLPGCKVYHHTPVIRLEDEEGEKPTPYCVWEYTSADCNTALVGVFKLTAAPEPYRFHPKGLINDRKYRLTFDNSASTCIMDGYTIREQGILVNLPGPLTSELIQIKAAD